jgi:hypothetical protein
MNHRKSQAYLAIGSPQMTLLPTRAAAEAVIDRINQKLAEMNQAKTK